MRYWCAVMCLLLASISWAAGASLEVTPPVALFTPPPVAPKELAGSGAATAVTVDVTIDVAGKVSRIDVRSVEPKGAHDALVAEVIREALSGWRYAPAVKDGAPVEARLTWTVEFPEFDVDEQPENTTDRLWQSIEPGELAADEHRRFVLSLPLAERTRLLAEKAEIAHKCLAADSTKRFDSPRFIVFTDSPSAEISEVLARNLEAAFNILQDLIGERLPPQPEPNRVVTFMYRNEGEFNDLKERVTGLEWTAGFYSPLGMLAFHQEMPSTESLLSIMLHEATHAYLDRYVARPGVLLPRWLDEGLAEYVGNSEIKKGKLVAGKTRRAESYQGPRGKVRAVSMPRLSVDEVRKAVREKRALSLEQIVGGDRELFYGPERGLYYAQSWLLIHFLRHGNASWTDERFADLLLYTAEGYPAAQALRELYGEPASLEAAYGEYIRGF